MRFFGDLLFLLDETVRLFHLEDAKDGLIDALFRDGAALDGIQKGTFDSYWKGYMNDLDLKYGKRVKKVRSKFDPGRGRMVIKTFNPHQLRHTYATIMYDAGVDVLVMQKQLGHEDIQTTLGIYAELTRTRERRVQNEMNDYIMKNIQNAREEKQAKSG